MNTQTTGAGDKTHPDLPAHEGGIGENGSQREENDFDRGSNRDRHADKRQPEEAGPGRASQTPPQRGRY
jgi:hypothetical protein